eukprot:12153094-Prorocentrum_lima.AAC.1
MSACTQRLEQHASLLLEIRSCCQSGGGNRRGLHPKPKRAQPPLADLLKEGGGLNADAFAWHELLLNANRARHLLTRESARQEAVPVAGRHAPSWRGGVCAWLPR